MKNKWLFSAILGLILGLAIYLNNCFQPNQEIIVQFSNTADSNTSVEETLATLKTQLKLFGASNILVTKTHSGAFHILYYSPKNAAKIKQLLNAKCAIQGSLENSKEHKSNPSTFKFDVFELYKNQTSDSGFGHKQVVCVNQDSDRFLNPTNAVFKAHGFKAYFNLKTPNTPKIGNYSPAKLNKVVCKTDQVRAGPFMV